MNISERDRHLAQADILEDMARWCMQPDVPSGIPGVVTALDLNMRAAALRAMADVEDNNNGATGR